MANLQVLLSREARAGRSMIALHTFPRTGAPQPAMLWRTILAPASVTRHAESICSV
jgi:hypothetical protein